MNNIDGYISTINSAIRGEDVRQAIVGALTQINTNDSNAYTLNGHPASFFAKQSDMEKLLPLASAAIEGNIRPITSGGAYAALMEIKNAIIDVNGEEV